MSDRRIHRRSSHLIITPPVDKEVDELVDSKKRDQRGSINDLAEEKNLISKR